GDQAVQEGAAAADAGGRHGPGAEVHRVHRVLLLLVFYLFAVMAVFAFGPNDPAQ
ncbi:unnamed protein product, partial [Heterosigma akashiwo]